MISYLRVLLFYFLSIGLLGAQVAFYGLRAGGTFYHYRTRTANFRPSAGWEIGAGAKFSLNPKSPWKIMPEFGYFMGNSRTTLDSSQFLSVLSGRYVQAPTKISIWTHYLLFQCLLRYHFEMRDQFAVYFGGQALYLLGQTLIAQYVQDSSQFQEWLSNPVENALTVLPRITWNFTWGISFQILPHSHHHWFLYAQFIHQLNAYFYPSGAVIGIRFYQGRKK